MDGGQAGRGEGPHIAIGKALEAVVHGVDLVPVSDGQSHGRPHGRVHARRRGAHIQDGEREVALQGRQFRLSTLTYVCVFLYPSTWTLKIKVEYFCAVIIF